MSFTELLALFGGLTVVFYLLKLTWRCWSRFREFVLSEFWYVDLRTFGQWAGKVSYILCVVSLATFNTKVKTFKTKFREVSS